MFAGEATPPAPTAASLVSAGQPPSASTAFDRCHALRPRPRPRPDIYGKVGNSGVSIATLDDMKLLYDGFDLCDPATSVSMTINGPAPTIPAMFMNTAIDQRLPASRPSTVAPTAPEAAAPVAPRCSRKRAPSRPTSLNGRPGQNTCIFSTEFSLRSWATLPRTLQCSGVRNLPVSHQRLSHRRGRRQPHHQLALTLSTVFTYVEAYLRAAWLSTTLRANLSFFFSNGGWTLSTACSAALPAASGPSRCVTATAPPSAAKSQVHVQTSGRSRTRRRSPSTTSAPRCRPSSPLRPLQQPAHQRLRRGHHYAHH